MDDIIHLGEYWDEKGIRKNRLAVIEKGETISKWYARAYNYLSAAEKLYDNAAAVYSEAVESAEIYKIAAEIVGKELSHKEICLRPGNIKKYFASAITPSGFVNYLPSIAEGCKKIYLISAPFGASAHSILDIFAEGAVYRGFAVEEYFCPLKPDSKMEHLVVPELSLAFITANEYHDVEPWQLPEGTESIELLDMDDMANASVIERRKKLLDESQNLCDMMMKKAIECIEEAKKEHDVLESYYIPNMDFKKIDKLRDEIIAKIRSQEV